MAARLRSLALPIAEKTQNQSVLGKRLATQEAREYFADHCASCRTNNGSGLTLLGPGLSPQAPAMRLRAAMGLGI